MLLHRVFKASMRWSAQKSLLEEQRCISLLLKALDLNSEKRVPLLAQSLAPAGLWLQKDANYSRDTIQKEPQNIVFPIQQ